MSCDVGEATEGFEIDCKCKCNCNCLCSVIVLCEMMMMMKVREKVKPGTDSSRKAPRGPPGLTSPSDGLIAINSIICLLNIYAAEGFEI